MTAAMAPVIRRGRLDDAGFIAKTVLLAQRGPRPLGWFAAVAPDPPASGIAGPPASDADPAGSSCAIMRRMDARISSIDVSCALADCVIAASPLPAASSHDASANQAVQFRRSIGKASGDTQAMQDVMPGRRRWKTSCVRMPLFPVGRTNAGPDIADLLVMVHRVVNRRRQAQVDR